MKSKIFSEPKIFSEREVKLAALNATQAEIEAAGFNKPIPPGYRPPEDWALIWNVKLRTAICRLKELKAKGRMVAEEFNTKSVINRNCRRTFYKLVK